MIRAVVALFCFALALCAYIVVRPFSDTDISVLPGPEIVTRADTPTALVPAPLLTDESSMQEMTQGVLAGLGVTPAAAQDGDLRDLTAGALAAIGKPRVSPIPTPPRRPLCKRWSSKPFGMARPTPISTLW